MSERPNRMRGAEYDAEKRTLTVRFITGTYVYSGVPLERGNAIARMHGDELGYAFDTGIEGRYKSERVGA